MITPDTIHIYIDAMPSDLTSKMKYNGKALSYHKDNFYATLNENRFLIICFSVPKVLYGTNYEIYDFNYSEQIIEKLNFFISEVLICPVDYKKFAICRLDIQNNITMRKGSIKHYFEYLNKLNFLHNTRKAKIQNYNPMFNCACFQNELINMNVERRQRFVDCQTGKRISFSHNTLLIYDKHEEIRQKNQIQFEPNHDLLRFEVQLRGKCLKKYKPTIDKILTEKSFLNQIFYEEIKKYDLHLQVLQKNAYMKILKSNSLTYSPKFMKKLMSFAIAINRLGINHPSINKKSVYYKALKNILIEKGYSIIYSDINIKSFVDTDTNNFVDVQQIMERKNNPLQVINSVGKSKKPPIKFRDKVRSVITYCISRLADLFHYLF